MRRDSVAGRCSSSAGTSTCAVMMVATPASIAALNGTNSTSRSRSGGCSTSGSSWCESVLVSPCPGKCLPQAATPAPCSAAMIARAEARRPSAASLAERAIADDGILRVGVDVEHRRVVERDADRFQLRGQRPREPLGQRDVAAAPERRHRRPLGERRLQPRDPPAFLIDAAPTAAGPASSRAASNAQLRHLLGLRDVAREQDHAAQSELARERLQLDGKLVAVEAGDQELADLAPQRAGDIAPRFYRG